VSFEDILNPLDIFGNLDFIFFFEKSGVRLWRLLASINNLDALCF
jgi:hypothetical protein